MRGAESNPYLQLHSNPGWHQEIQENIQEELIKMSYSKREDDFKQIFQLNIQSSTFRQDQPLTQRNKAYQCCAIGRGPY